MHNFVENESLRKRGYVWIQEYIMPLNRLLRDRGDLVKDSANVICWWLGF